MDIEPSPIVAPVHEETIEALAFLSSNQEDITPPEFLTNAAARTTEGVAREDRVRWAEAVTNYLNALAERTLLSPGSGLTGALSNDLALVAIVIRHYDLPSDDALMPILLEWAQTRAQERESDWERGPAMVEVIPVEMILFPYFTPVWSHPSSSSLPTSTSSSSSSPHSTTGSHAQPQQPGPQAHPPNTVDMNNNGELVLALSIASAHGLYFAEAGDSHPTTTQYNGPAHQH